jgi:hypothetical protein
MTVLSDGSLGWIQMQISSASATGVVGILWAAGLTSKTAQQGGQNHGPIQPATSVRVACVVKVHRDGLLLHVGSGMDDRRDKWMKRQEPDISRLTSPRPCSIIIPQLSSSQLPFWGVRGVPEGPMGPAKLPGGPPSSGNCSALPARRTAHSSFTPATARLSAFSREGLSRTGFPPTRPNPGGPPQQGRPTLREPRRQEREGTKR